MRRIYLGLIIVCLLSSPQYGSAQSSALTPTSINGPTLSATPQEEGAYSLDSRMGAAVYHFQFKLPPGRGVAPTLALNYSSAGRLRGEIADGWSLGDLPSIRRDVTREHGTAARQFTAYLEGVQELLPVSGDVTAFGGTAYRARIDRTFTRFELVNAVDSSFWIVSTPDGHQKRFDLFMPGDWRMTRSIDQWGNEADYTYSPVGIGGKTVDFVIAEIDYSLNRPGQTNQALPPLIAAHARVRFEYDQNPPNCTYAGDPGLRLPIGARLDYLTGSLRITGVWRLTGIVTEVLDTTASEWRAVRHWTLDIGISDQGCNARTSPRRQLLAISEVGFATTAGTTISTPAPTVRFRYGPLPYSTPVQTLASDIPMFASKGCTDPIRGAIVGPNDFEGSVGTMLVDLDGDGLLDLLASGSSTVNCTATWRRNLGGAFDPITHQLALPSGNGNSGRSCGLTNALGIEEFDPTPSCTGVHEKTALYYHWADVDGDGFTDLLVGGSTVDDRIFQPAPAAAAPPCIKPSCGLPGVSCNTETQCADAYAVPDGTRIPSVALTCEQMRNPYFRNPPPPSKPAKRCLGGYVWLVFKNQGGVIANQPESWCSPVALQSNPPAWNQVAAPSAASLFQLIDMNGDGIADIVSASFSEAVPYNDDYRSGRYCPKKTPDDPEARNQRLVFNVFLGDGRGNFGTPQLWTAPSWPLQCFDEEPVWTLLLDLNGDGLPDLIHETEGPTGQVIHAAYNTGHGFTLDDVTLLSNVSLFPARSRVDLFGRAEPNFSACNATFDAFVKDIDGDGIPDVACPANASCPALAPNQEVGPLNSFGYGAGFNIGVRDDVLEVHTQTEDGCRGNSVWVGRTAQVWRNFYQYRDQLTPGCGEVVGKGIRQDYLDITGNGVSERVLANTPALVSPGEIDLWSPPDDTAPGLLVEIDNGIGGRVRFRYARSRDASIVHVNSARPSYARSWTDWIVPSLPFGLWVVKEIDVFDGRREQPSATGYLYEDPVFAPEEMTFTPAGRVAASFNATFRGFQAVTTRLPRNDGDLEQAISFERYNYRQDPAGLPDYRTMKVIHQSLTFLRESQALPGASIVKETVDQTVYTTELFLNVIRFVHPLESWHIECVPSVDDGACDAQAAFRTTMTFDYRAFGVAPFFPPPRRPGDLFPDYGTPNHPAPILFALEGVRADSTTAENGALQRQSWTNHLAVLNTGIYLLLPIRRLTIERKLDGNVPQTWEQYFYDGSATSTICGSAFGACKGAITKLREFRTLGGAGTSPESSELVCDPATCLDFGFWYDGTTGNLTRIARPSEMRNLGGSAQNSSLSLTYDDTGLFHTDTFDGAGHWIQEKFDIGTGALLSTAGPELTPCNVATCLPGPRVTRIFTYDGLGRLLAESAGHDTTGTLPSAYELRVMRTRSYSDYRPEQRFNEVIERRALDWTGSTGNWTAERLLTDGLGRPFFVEISPDGVSFTSGSLAKYSYVYDQRGRLSSVSSPDPSNDANLVTIGLTYDARGRRTSLQLPDGSITIVRYAPWQVQVIDADGDFRQQTVDGFGQLREIFEGGSVSADTAHTYYDYDSVGRLDKIVDADRTNREAASVFIRYDSTGRRLAITRPEGRVWQFSYDEDGRIAQKIDPDQRITHYQYDSLGRLADEVAISNPVLPRDLLSRLGLRRIHYTYDLGSSPDAPNQIYSHQFGRLARVDLISERPSTSPVTYANIIYGYDPRGHLVNQDFSVHLPSGMAPVAIDRFIQMSYAVGPSGNILQQIFPNGRAAVMNYTNRAELQAVTVDGRDIGHFIYGLSGHPRSRSVLEGSGAPVQTHSFKYDVRGRLVDENISIRTTNATNNVHIGRQYTYTPQSDIRRIDVDELTSDIGTLNGSFAFGYDALHRLASGVLSLSSGTLPAYNATWTYSPSGNLRTISAGPTVDLPDRTGVVSQYGDGTSADLQAVTALLKGDTTLASFQYDSSGNLTQRTINPGATATFSYDTNDEVLTANTDSNSDSEEDYYYGPDRQRFLAVRRSGAWRFYFGSDYELDVFGSTQDENLFIAGGMLRLESSCTGCPDQATFLYRDQRGDLLAAFDEGGKLQAHFLYGGFGELLHKFEVKVGDWKRTFGGAEEDNLDNLAYYGYRFYDKLGTHWSSPDPMLLLTPDLGIGTPQRLNLYAFTVDNPVSDRDLMGLCDELNPFGCNPIGFEPAPPLSGELGGDAGRGSNTPPQSDYDLVRANPHRNPAYLLHPVASPFYGSYYDRNSECANHPVMCGLDVLKHTAEVELALAGVYEVYAVGTAALTYYGVRYGPAAADEFESLVADLSQGTGGTVLGEGAVPESLGSEGTVSVFHGSIDNGAQVLEHGLDPSRTPVFVSRDIQAAQDALLNHPDAVPGLGTIIESRIPASQFQLHLLPLERPYSGFYPYALQSSEITLRTPVQIQLFNLYILRF